MSSAAAGAEPLVTVVALCFHHERYVEQCLDSIAAQDGVRVQLVVTDDASTDGTLEVVRRWCDRTALDCTVVANDVNVGLTATLNRALAHVRGDFVAVIAADDWMEPGRLAAQVAWLEEHPDLLAVSGDLRRVDDDGRPVDEDLRPVGDDLDRATIRPRPGSWDAPDPFVALVEGNWVAAPTVLLRRAAYDVAGRYDESLPSEDLSMWLRLADRGHRIGYRPGVVTDYRQHGASMTSSMRPSVVAGTVRLFLGFVGSEPDRDRLLWRRIGRLSRELHQRGHDPSVVRGFLRRALLHERSRKTAVALAESWARLEPGSLAARRPRRRR